MSAVQLRCYCCGEPVGTMIALVTMSSVPVDRVFIALPEHIERFDDETTRSLVVVPSSEPTES